MSLSDTAEYWWDVKGAPHFTQEREWFNEFIPKHG